MRLSMVMTRDSPGVTAIDRQSDGGRAHGKGRQMAFPPLRRGSILRDTRFTKSGQEPNGIKLASERLLDQLPAQLLSGFNHKGEALGSPLLDPRLHTIGARGVHDQRY
jgi:hypothetical protein